MTVKELISKLKEVPQDLEVHLVISHEFGDCNYVTVEKANGIYEEHVLIED